MIFCQNTFTLLGVCLIFSAFQFQEAESIRLCGRRLADILSMICQRHGGFHAPRERRDVTNKASNKRAVIEVFKPVARRTVLESPEYIPESHSNAETAFAFQNDGVVDECCKKQCTFSTLVSYCANDQLNGNLNLDEILPGENESIPEGSAAYQQHQIPSASALESSNGASGHEHPPSSSLVYSNRPNLGLSSRNRPVFIVLSQLQDEDRALGEYRF